jgi:hypothetical protein
MSITKGNGKSQKDARDCRMNTGTIHQVPHYNPEHQINPGFVDLQPAQQEHDGEKQESKAEIRQ